jgi:hypothetical protein
MYVYSAERGVRKLKEDVTLEQYAVAHAFAVKPIVCKKPPTLKTLEKWSFDGVAKALDGCKVEPDGHCQHGLPSWLLALNYI